jgi:hypothetical protein
MQSSSSVAPHSLGNDGTDTHPMPAPAGSLAAERLGDGNGPTPPDCGCPASSEKSTPSRADQGTCPAAVEGVHQLSGAATHPLPAPPGFAAERLDDGNGPTAHDGAQRTVGRNVGNDGTVAQILPATAGFAAERQDTRNSNAIPPDSATNAHCATRVDGSDPDTATDDSSSLPPTRVNKRPRISSDEENDCADVAGEADATSPAARASNM